MELLIAHKKKKKVISLIYCFIVPMLTEAKEVASSPRKR